MTDINDQSAKADHGAGSDFDAAALETKRVAPRSPRAALEPERVPEPIRPSKKARHPVVVVGSAIFTILVLLMIAAGFVLYEGRDRFIAPGPLASDRVVNIPRGLGLRDIADLLQREGVIDQPWVFVGGTLLLKAREDLKFGEYLFLKQASLHDVVETIVEGKVVQHQITIPEGLTSEQIIARLTENDVLTGNVREIPKEGTLLPESYKFVRGTTREQLIVRMQQAQKRAVQEIWDRHLTDLPLKSPEQLVVLASIIEKETAKPDERTRVAAVFVNRIKQHMKLQSDPTIIYGLVGGKGALGHSILRSEIEQPTPYNTYVIDGLPPGPIGNPGRASLEAAANPARTKELFFVADGTGGHVFSENLEQHQKNVTHLRQLEQQKDAPPEPDPSVSSSPPQSPPVPPPSAPPSRAPAATQPAASNPPHAGAHPAPSSQPSGVVRPVPSQQGPIVIRPQ